MNTDSAVVDEQRMTIIEHLAELRNRLVKSVIAVAVASAVGFYLSDRTIGLLMALAQKANVQVVSIGVTEVFTTYFRVALISGLALAMPVLIYQLVRFIAPGLTDREKHYLFLLLPFIALAFIIGIVFGYFVVLPSALEFLLTFGRGDILRQPRLDDYLGFVTTFLFWIGVSFETPVIIYALSKLGVVTPRMLSHYRRYAIVAAFIIAAIITPTPDPLNQTIVAVPIILLYELGGVLARWF